MIKVVINAERCKGCFLCIHFCPKGSLSMGDLLNTKGYQYVIFTDGGECTGCAACGKLCPDLAINVYRE